MKRQRARDIAEARANRAERLAELVEVAQAVVAQVGDIRTGVRGTAWAVALGILDEMSKKEIAPQYLHHAASAVEKLVGVARIESGEATSQSLNLTASPNDFQEWKDRLRLEVKRHVDVTARERPDNAPAVEASSSER